MISSDEDLEYAIQMMRWLLKSLGIWPLDTDKATILDKVIVKFIVLICWLLLAFIILPGFFLFMIVESSAVKLRLTGPLSFCLMGILKYYALNSGQRDLAISLNDIIDDWHRVRSLSDRDIMMKYTKMGRFGATIASAFMYFGALFYGIILPQRTGSVVNEFNQTIRPFSYPSYYGYFDPQVSPTYEIIYSLHCCGAFVMHSITSITSSIAVFFTMHACGQFQIVISWLESFVHQKEINDGLSLRNWRLKEFANIIEQHERTLRFVEKMNIMMNEICLVEVAGCALNICLLGYYMLLELGGNTEEVLTYFLLLCSFLFNIFILCYAGEFLTEKSVSVADVAYDIEWEDLPSDIARGMILIILTAQRPVYLEAGKFVQLSHLTFGTVVRTSMGYLNMLRQFMA